MAVWIVDLTECDAVWIEAVARFLHPCFARFSPTWLPDHAACLGEVRESFEPERRSRVLVEDGQAVAWIGAFEDEHAWEIHPIAVAPGAQRNGYGLRLVDDVIELARAAGAVSVWAGTSDETGSTSFSALDLYANPAAAFGPWTAHPEYPVNFWFKTGFSLVGVLPDDEGLGKPGLHFARRIVEAR